MATRRKIAFLDRDGTLIREPADQQVDTLEKLSLMPDVVPALLALREAEYELVMVTNQDGLGTETYPQAAFDLVQGKMLEMFASQGITFDAVHLDRSVAHAPSPDRKPGVGMVRCYLADPTLDRENSFVAGDRDSDLVLAANMGLRAIRVGEHGREWMDVVRDVTAGPRTAALRRQTRETTIDVRVDLDVTSAARIKTGIPFFDHMLDQVARHGGFLLELLCSGDLEVDEHHTIEDCALALGAALSEALGERRGIERYGFVLPMDEARATVALDLGGRAWCRFEGRFDREYVGGMPTEMVEHFFASLASALRATVHVTVEGGNSHHQVEACFKGLGRTLRQAVRRSGTTVPSTKGVIT